MVFTLSKRLNAVANMVIKGEVIADIGTDHALLPSYLVLNKICPKAICVDIEKGPIEKAKKIVNDLKLNNLIDIRQGNGLAVLNSSEVSTICICGMGSITICDILNSNDEVLAKVKRLVLQPQKDAFILRDYLEKKGYKIIDEDIVFESGIYYQVIAAEKEEELENKLIKLSATEKEFGPILIKKSHPILIEFIKYKINKKNIILKQLDNSIEKKASKKIIKFKNQIINELKALKSLLNSFMTKKENEK